MSGLEQMNDGRWPSGDGKALFVIDEEPASLSSRLGIAFKAGDGDLGPSLGCGLRLPSGRLVFLLRHVPNAHPGTEVHVDSADGGGDAVEEILAALQLTIAQVTWRHPDFEDRA